MRLILQQVISVFHVLSKAIFYCINWLKSSRKTRRKTKWILFLPTSTDTFQTQDRLYSAVKLWVSSC